MKFLIEINAKSFEQAAGCLEDVAEAIEFERVSRVQGHVRAGVDTLYPVTGLAWRMDFPKRKKKGGKK
jgi:hypothetical protein